MIMYVTPVAGIHDSIFPVLRFDILFSMQYENMLILPVQF